MQRVSPFRVMNLIFVGLVTSFAYGAIGAALIYWQSGQTETQLFAVAYTSTFKTLFSLGLILGAALVVGCTQSVIPETIEAAFTKEQLSKTDYFSHKNRFGSRRRSMTFAAYFVVVAFLVFTRCEFPLGPLGKNLMIAAACAQYALGVYIGRKLFYAGMMLQSLHAVTVARNLFKGRELDAIDSYVHVASTLTIIFVYVHVVGYYGGPFRYGAFWGASIKPLLLIPPIIATPVLAVFSFYPRSIMKKVYSESIDVEIGNLRTKLRNEDLGPFEKRTHVMEFDKMCREELRYSLQLTLADLPMGITILVMLLEPLLKS